MLARNFCSATEILRSADAENLLSLMRAVTQNADWQYNPESTPETTVIGLRVAQSEKNSVLATIRSFQDVFPPPAVSWLSADGGAGSLISGIERDAHFTFIASIPFPNPGLPASVQISCLQGGINLLLQKKDTLAAAYAQHFAKLPAVTIAGSALRR